MKKIKLWFYLYKEEIVGIFKIFIPLILLVFLARNISLISRNIHLLRLDVEVTGVVDSIEKIQGIQETEIGGMVVVKSYKIVYHYVLQDVKIIQTEIMQSKGLFLKQRIILNNLQPGDSILVKCDSENIKQSKLQIE